MENMENCSLFDVQIKNLNILIENMDNNKSDDLSNIMSMYKSDKGFGLCKEYINDNNARPPNQVCHNYTFVYTNLFSSIRDKDICIFEMGVGVPDCMGSWAGSLLAWKKYFPNSEVFSADFDNDYLYNKDGIRSFM
jgi:hypothetical protein